MKASGASGEGTTSSAGLKPLHHAPEHCPGARKGLSYYQDQWRHWRAKMGAGQAGLVTPKTSSRLAVYTCPQVRAKAKKWRLKAKQARKAYLVWWDYHWNWPKWLPAKWQRIGACETGYGKRPGNWRHSNSSYEGAFGFAKSSWDSFKLRADPKAGPYPADAWMATPRQQYEVALAIWRAYGFSGWGCRNA